jgi:hypothetical protein
MCATTSLLHPYSDRILLDMHASNSGAMPPTHSSSLCTLRLVLQVLQQAMEEHIQRASTAFKGNTAAHTTLLATLAALSADPQQPMAREVAGMAAMKVLSGGMAPELLVELAQQVEGAEDNIEAAAWLLSAMPE